MSISSTELLFVVCRLASADFNYMLTTSQIAQLLSYKQTFECNGNEEYNGNRS